ncbi:transducin/WD40 repeat-like superfamily protein [Actinidia rufa]|uniref:Transducin/WD40 repeat-like superfamily protein n=1 Tax=Actinidia rufa TaxID=165716 RepID=A0A7J0E0M3_9ERIC|nr:transducin/WD40 repeat-like superfamily protein [Actinidia rufa]
MGAEEAQRPPNSDKEFEEITKETSNQVEYSWPPAICFDVPPARTYHFSHQFRTPSNPNNFLKGIKWSPDGSCFLTSAEDNTFRVFPLPDYGADYDGNTCSFAADTDSYTANLVVNGGESIYDFCWYPYMSASDPVTCVFASTTRDHPIHLWDATSGELRCTYRAYDAMDEITAAFSIGFNPAGTKIFAGYNKSLRVFDIHRPGRDFLHHSTVQGNKEGQSVLERVVSAILNENHGGAMGLIMKVVCWDAGGGACTAGITVVTVLLPAAQLIENTGQGAKTVGYCIISAIAFCPSHTKMLATGSYSQTTAIYGEDNMELLYILHGQEGGVTHDPYILCWDIRKTVDIVYKLYRSSENTNQRIMFDVDPLGQHLGTGGQDGLVHIYNLQTGQWVSSFQAALDTVNGFSFHPYLPMAAASSGHRRFETLDDSPEDLSLSGDENCASIWSFPSVSMADDAGDIDL